MHGKIIRRVIRYLKIGHIAALWLLLFIICSISVTLAEPAGTYTLGQGIWYSFQAATTIGFGDIVTTSLLVHICTMLLSFVSLFFFALLTGGVVSYFSEVAKLRNRDSLEAMIDRAENLENLSREELAEMSAKVRELMDAR